MSDFPGGSDGRNLPAMRKHSSDPWVRNIKQISEELHRYREQNSGYQRVEWFRVVEMKSQLYADGW